MGLKCVTLKCITCMTGTYLSDKKVLKLVIEILNSRDAKTL